MTKLETQKKINKTTNEEASDIAYAAMVAGRVQMIQQKLITYQ